MDSAEKSIIPEFNEKIELEQDSKYFNVKEQLDKYLNELTL
jgi:hypothetical protein